MSSDALLMQERNGKGREGKGREGKGREGKGREGKGRKGKERKGKDEQEEEQQRRKKGQRKNLHLLASIKREAKYCTGLPRATLLTHSQCTKARQQIVTRTVEIGLKVYIKLQAMHGSVVCEHY